MVLREMVSVIEVGSTNTEIPPSRDVLVYVFLFELFNIIPVTGRPLNLNRHMLKRLDHGSYEIWVKQFLAPGTKEYEVTEDNTRLHVSTQYTQEERAANENTILQLIIAHAQKKEYRSLCMMGEYLRARGHFYWDTTPVMRETLQLLLQQANETIDNGEVFRDPYVLCLANSVYDIVFHQIRFERYELICEALYNQLTAKIGNEKFVQSWQDAEKNFVGEYFPGGYYEQCDYFINFGKNEEEDDDVPPTLFFDLRAFEDKEEQLVSTADILRMFEKYTVEKLRDSVRLNFEDAYYGTVMMHTDREKQCCIMILSLDMHESLLRCVYEVMQLGNFVYTKPGGKELIILSPEVAKHQANYMKDYNTPMVAATWETFLALHDVNGS